MPKNNLIDFVETQEILNSIRTAIKKLYADDPSITDDAFLKQLTERTLDVMNFTDKVHEELLEDDGVRGTASDFDCPVEEVASDIIEIMLYSTIARQNIFIEKIVHGEE